MRRELDYIEDDRAALRWAIGCVMASYAAQLATLPRLCGRLLSRPVLAGGMLLSVALALGHANDLTEVPGPAFEETACDLPDMSSVSPQKRAWANEAVHEATAPARRIHRNSSRDDARIDHCASRSHLPVSDVQHSVRVDGRNAPRW